MPITRAKSSRLIAVMAVVASLVAMSHVPGHADRASLTQSLNEAMRKGEYISAATQARSHIDGHPKDAEAYAIWILGLAMANRIEEAREALEVAKKALPELVEQYAQPMSDAIDKIQSGHRAQEEAESAVSRGLPYLAARKYTEAHELLMDDAQSGLKAAQAWATVHEHVKAALILGKLADKGDPAMVREARAFLDKYKGVLTSAAVNANDEGWKALESLGPDDDGIKANEAFQRAIALRPDHAGLAGVGMEPMRSPYIGLAMAAAVGSTDWEIRTAFKKGAANGLPVPSGSLAGRAGAALGVALCDETNMETQEGVYGDRGKAWGVAACERGRPDRNWQRAVDLFDKANRAGVAEGESKAGFEEAKGLFEGEWDARFPAATYSRRSTCNIAFLEAWIATSASPVDHAELDKAVAAASACPTDDFDRKELDARVAAIREAAAKVDTFTLKVCNRTSEDKVRVAYMRTKPDATDEFLLQGWWDIQKDKCRDLTATFAGADQADVYLTAYSNAFTWWPWEGADTTACVSSQKTERMSSLGEVACPLGEELRGFLKLTARKRPGKNGITFNLKNPS